MNTMIKNNSLVSSTDKLYELLADPDKLAPLKQTAKIVNNIRVTEDEDSFMVDYNNNVKKNSPVINFNSDHANNYDKKNDICSDDISKVIGNNISDTSSDSKKSKPSKLKPSKSPNFNDLDLKLSKHSSKSKSDSLKFGDYKSRLSSRNRESSINLDSDHIMSLKKTVSNNLKISMDDFSNDNNNNPPNIKPINHNLFGSNPSISNPNQPNHSNQPIQSVQSAQPIQPAQPNPSVPPINNIALQKQLKFKKMETLAKLMHIKSSGIELTKHYNMDSDFEEMEAELKYHSSIQSKKEGIELAKSFMCNGITFLEFANAKYDPFGFKLSGWSKQIKTDKDNFDQVFGELMDKYKSNGGDMPPEYKLIMMLLISGAGFHMSQTLSTGIPLIDDVIKNNPELMSKIRGGINGKVSQKISGPSEFEKKKELYENIKKMHDNKFKTQNPNLNSKPNSNPNPNPNPISNQPTKLKSILTNSNVPKSIQISQSKPTSVKNLLSDIKKSIPYDSTNRSYSITVGDTIDTETDSSTRIPTVSNGVKTRSRLAGRNNIQLKSN